MAPWNHLVLSLLPYITMVVKLTFHLPQQANGFAFKNSQRLFIHRRAATFHQAKPAERNEEIMEEDFPRSKVDNYAKTMGWESEVYHLMKKQKLEEDWKTGFLRSGARFLPYESCRAWVQSQSMWSSKDDWMEWINMGEKNVSIVPSDPEKIYKKRGTWVSWDHFLGVESTDDQKGD